MGIFCASPNDQVTNKTEKSSMITGSLKKDKTGFDLSSTWISKGIEVKIISSKAGSNEDKKLFSVPGNSLITFSAGLNNANGFTVIFFTVFANNGPAMITAGMAIHMPYNKTFPISA